MSSSEESAYKEPTYTTAIQVVKMIRRLEEEGSGEVSIADLANELEVHPRTVKRYIDAIGAVVDGPGDKGYIERVRRGRTPYARLNRTSKEAISITLFEYAALRLASETLRRVDPESLGHLASVAEEKTTKKLATREQVEAMKNFDDAFLYVPYGPKKYEGAASKHLRVMMEAIPQRQVLRLSYKGSREERPSKREVHPLAIVLYRDGLYLYAKQKKPKPAGKDYRYFALDRIQQIERDVKKVFKRPADFDPSELGQNSLGIWDHGTPQRVVLRFFEEGAVYAKERQWPNLISCEDTGPNEVTLEMKIPITPEVIAWLAGWGRFVKVVEPEELVDNMRNHLADALDYYV